MQHTKVNSTYEHALQYAFHKIDKRGILVDTPKLKNVEIKVQQDIDTKCNDVKNLCGIQVYVGKENIPDDKNIKASNLNAPKSMLEMFTNLGYKVPKVRKKNKETDEYEFKDSVGELALQQVLADPSRWPDIINGGKLVKTVLEIKELVTFRNRYVRARLFNNTYYTNYNVAATLTGRRGSRKTVFGFGGNNQNFPARGALSDIWRELLIARKDKILFFVDQKQAEDWAVQSLSENYDALTEMRADVNRHYKFASVIFGRPIDDLKKGRKSGNLQCEMEYYLGKKGRHANNYGMQPPRLSESLASEGFSIPKDTCTHILDTINKADPKVRSVFHEYIKKCISETRLLKNPLGRERQFFGLRPNDKNYKVFNEAYAWIPQSTIGDNNGMSILHLSNINNYLIHDGHDSTCQETKDDIGELVNTFHNTIIAYDRTITFHNGISVNIPIEGKIGYNWKDTVTIDPFTENGLVEAYKKLQEKEKEKRESLQNESLVSKELAR